MKNSLTNESFRSSLISVEQRTTSLTELLTVDEEETGDIEGNCTNDNNNNNDREGRQHQRSNNRHIGWNKEGLIYSFVSCVIADLNFSMIVTFFPTSAKKRGLNSFEIGIVFALYQTSNFFFSFLSPKIVKKFGGYAVLLTSNVLQAIVTGCMGLTVLLQPHFPFLITCSCIRILQGMLASFAEIASTKIIRDSVPDRVSLDALAWVELLRMFGIAIGPIVGGVVHTSFGYAPPFIFMASLLITIAVTMFVFPIETHSTEGRIRNNSDNPQILVSSLSPTNIRDHTRSSDLNRSQHSLSSSDIISISKFAKRPLIITMSIFIAIMSASITFVEPIMEPFLSASPRNLTEVSIALIYAVFMLSFSITLPTIYRSMCKSGEHYSLSTGILLLGIGYITLAPPKHFEGPLSISSFLYTSDDAVYIFSFIFGLTNVGFGIGICQLPIITIMLNEAEFLGLSRDEVTEYVPKIANFAFTAGTALGPFFGGISVQFIEFQKACVAFGYAILLSGIILIIAIRRLTRKREIENNDDESVSDLASSLLQPNNRFHEPSEF